MTRLENLFFKTKMKKVLFFTDTPIYGGAERQMIDLAKFTNPENYQVSVAFTDNQPLDQVEKELRESNIPVFRLKSKHKHDPSILFELKKIIKEVEPDILHLHLWNPGACRYAFYAIDPKKTKIVCTEHDPFLLSGMKRYFKEQCLKKTELTILVSHANEVLIQNQYPQLIDKTAVVHNGIDLAKFEKAIAHITTQEKQKIKDQVFKANNHDFIIISIAALHPRKGLKYLIEAYSKAVRDIPNSKLVLIGNGPEQKELEKQIVELKMSDKIIILNKVESIPKLLKCSDLFILPSLKEAFGLVLLEAMVCQLPIIASNVGGIPEIINGKNGVLVEPQSPNKLANKIVELYRSQPQREKLAFLGVNYGTSPKHYSLDTSSLTK